VDCVVDVWSSWTLCPDCVDVNNVPNTSRSRAILVQPANGGKACPVDLQASTPCPKVPCSVDCLVGPWSQWAKTCSVQCGDGFTSRTRDVVTPKAGNGMDCPPLSETDVCHRNCPGCILGPSIVGPCSLSCSNDGTQGQQIVSRTATLLQTQDDSGVITTVEQCPQNQTQVQNCSVPCCPVDCKMLSWGPWSSCVDGVRQRTRSVESPPICGGAACPVCLLEKDVCTWTPPATECEFGEACEEGYNTDANLPTTAA